MTELKETASNLAGTGDERSAAESRTYWQVVFRSFFRSPQHWIATGFVAGLAFLAVFVPFIANGRPYTAIIDGQRVYPLFKSLTQADLIILVVAAATLAYGIGHFWARRFREPNQRAKVRFRILGVVFVAALIPSVLIACLKQNFNDIYDRFDYLDMVQSGDAKGAIFAPLTWGYADQEPLAAKALFQDPSHAHVLGTDNIGRDALARLLWSTRIVLGIGFISVVISLIIGIGFGAMMGYFAGTVDIVGMRFLELVEAVPVLFLLITFVAVFGRQIFMIMVILGLLNWPGIARFVRAEFLRIRKLDYVTAAVAAGLPLRNILFKHMLPNGLTPVLVNATFAIAGAVTLESSLSFLGLGVEPPTPSWGAMLDQASDPAQTFHFWLAFTPGLLIFLTILTYNILGEGMRDSIDPQLNKTM